MNKFWIFIGKFCYFFIFPLLVVIIRFTTRTRVIVDFNGKILVVKGWLGNGKWMLPGGGLHGGEKPKMGAIRELNEETGIRIKSDSINQITEGKYKQGFIKFDFNLFYTNLDNKVETKKQKFEIIDIAWIERSEINKKNSTKELITLLKYWI